MQRRGQREANRDRCKSAANKLTHDFTKAAVGNVR